MAYTFTSVSDLKTITDQTRDALDTPVDPNDIGCVIDKINLLSLLLGPSANAVALAERMYNRTILDLMARTDLAKLTPADKKLMFDGLTRFESYYLTLTLKQSKALIYSLDSLRLIAYKLDGPSLY